MKLQLKHIPYGVILVLVVWILLQDRAHERRVFEMQDAYDSISDRLRRRDIEANLFESRASEARFMYESQRAARMRADNYADSLLRIINSPKPHANRPARTRTSDGLRESILRATRQK